MVVDMISQLNNGPFGGELLIDGKAPAAGQVFKVSHHITLHYMPL